MKFQYSICEPLEKEIIYAEGVFNGKEIIDIAENYPWLEKLLISKKYKPEEIHFSPSLDFAKIGTNQKFCLTANFDRDENLEFSL